MLHSLQVLCLIYYSSVTGGILSVNNKSNNQEAHHYQKVATSCLVSAIENIFLSRMLITILAKDNLDTPGFEIQQSLISTLSYNWSIEVTNGADDYLKKRTQAFKVNDETMILEKSNQYVILINSVESLKRYIHSLKSLQSRYFVYFFKNVPNYKKIIEELFIVFYNTRIFKVTILIPISKYELNLFGYDLYNGSVICADSPGVVRLNSCINGTYMENKFTVAHDFKNLNCSINVLSIKKPPFIVDANTGFEINLLREIAFEMNVKFNIINMVEDSIDWGRKINGTWDNLLGILKNEPFMIGIGGVWLTNERQNEFDYTDFYYIDRTVWVVPAALEMVKWKSYLYTFSLYLWLCLFGVLMTFALFFYCGSKYKKSEYNVFKGIGAGFVLSFQLFLGQPAKTQPKTKVLRILYIHQAMFCIVIVCVFQSKLIGFMTNPVYYKEINSEKAVYDSGIGIGGMRLFKDIFYNQDDDRLMKIYKNYETYDRKNDTLLLWLLTVAKDRDTITILNEAYVKYMIAIGKQDIVNHDGTPKVFIVPEILYTLSVGIIFHKGFPLKDPFNEVIRGLMQAGFIEKWRNEIFTRHNFPKDHVEIDFNDKTYGLNILSFKDISGAFTFLIAGYNIGTIVFVLEILQNKIERRLRRTKRSI